MAMLKIKKGDTVKVIAGKDCNAEGKVVSIDMRSPRPRTPTAASSTWKLLLISPM